MDTTEARYGETGRIMAELNDWVTPWFDYGVPFWGKPPLAFWVTAASFKAFGVNEFTARLPHLAIALFIVGLAAWLAARRDRDAALPTVALMTGSFLYFISAAVVMIDIELILGTTLAMAGFWLALEAPDSRRRAGLRFTLGRSPDRCSSAASSWVCWRRGGGLGHGRHPNALLDGIQPPLARRLAASAVAFRTALTLLLALPWYWIAELRTPGFLEYFLVGEHWHRYITRAGQATGYGNPHYFRWAPSGDLPLSTRCRGR